MAEHYTEAKGSRDAMTITARHGDKRIVSGAIARKSVVGGARGGPD
jgi:hypothetical protein